MKRFAWAALVAIAAWGVPVGAHAASLCITAADCPTTPLGGRPSCSKSKIFGIELFFGTCGLPGACNSGADCIAQAQCVLGQCARPPGTCVAESDCADDERCVARRCETNVGPGPGAGIPGEGKRCMPADGSKPPDWAKDKLGKPLGACPSGTRCTSNGYCVRLEQ
jgi:hypothetical protein